MRERRANPLSHGQPVSTDARCTHIDQIQTSPVHPQPVTLCSLRIERATLSYVGCSRKAETVVCVPTYAARRLDANADRRRARLHRRVLVRRRG